MKTAQQEKWYSLGLMGIEEAPSIVLFNKKIKFLKRVVSYKDSANLIKGYRVHSSFLKEKRRSKIIKKLWFLYSSMILVAFSIIGVSSAFGYLTYEKGRAQDFIENGDFASASEIIDKYEFSNKEEYRKIINAANSLGRNDYEQAITDFTSIGGEVNIEYDYQNGNTDFNNPTVIRPKRINNPMKNGYVSGTWDVIDFSFTVSTRYSLSMRLKAEYTGLYVYRIRYFLNGGTNSSQNQSNFTVESPSISIRSPSKTGSTFVAWYRNPDFSGNIVTYIPSGSYGDIDLYARWTLNSYTISFEENGGSSIGDITDDFGYEIIEPEPPVRTGYSFGGWYTDMEFTTPFMFSTMPPTNITLYAKWILLTYTINYHFDNGDYSYDFDYYTIADSTFTLQIPTQTGYSFLGWYDNPYYNGEPITSIQNGSTGDIDLYAKWSINQYTVSYDSNGGSQVDSFVADYGSSIPVPLPPSRDGYNFGGWYSNAELTIMFDFDTLLSTNTILYAGWNPITYSITYYLNGGTHTGNPSSYTIITPTITLNAATKIGNAFGGWYDNPSFVGNQITTINTGTTGNLSIYAKWNINQYSIIYKELVPYQVNNAVAGYSHSIALTTNGRIYTWGSNSYGQIGDATTTNRNIPTDITSRIIGTVTMIAAGSSHSAAITSTGRVYTWGLNTYGQIGDATTTYRTLPTNITSRITGTVTSIVTGLSHTMALTSTGRVYAWGFNNSGQIGDATTTNRNIPTEITSRISGTVTSIAAGGNHSFALTSTGRVYAWGYNLYGQIGDATKINRTVPTEITSRISGMVTSVAAGGNHSIALTSTGRIYTWGLNSSGEIGDATTTNRTTPTEITSRIAVTASMISAGYSHSAAITSTGRVYTWGSNSNGQIGDATTTNKNVPTEISSRINGTVTSISAGGIHTIVLTSTGRIVAWGYNGYGQLGDSTNVDKIIPKDTSYFLAKEALTIKTSLYDYGQVTSPYNQSRAGYTFSGWYSDINLTISYAFSTMPAFDVTLYGKYIPVS